MFDFFWLDGEGMCLSSSDELITCTSQTGFEYVTCGSAVKLAHVPTEFRLHSHKVAYGTGSKQQVELLECFQRPLLSLSLSLLSRSPSLPSLFSLLSLSSLSIPFPLSHYRFTTVLRASFSFS